MGFKESEADALLIACHRRCCVCHRSCGFKMELHHIDQRSESKDDSIENAIPLCFECHAEVQLYNDKHPRGCKFHPRELRGHKEQWLRICKEQSALAFATPRASDGEVGPLQALIDELEFNTVVAAYPSPDDQGCLFLDEQFRRAIREGAIAILEETLKQSIIEAYVAIGRANQAIAAAMRHGRDTTIWGTLADTAEGSISQASPKIGIAKKQLLELLASEIPG